MHKHWFILRSLVYFHCRRSSFGPMAKERRISESLYNLREHVFVDVFCKCINCDSFSYLLLVFWHNPPQFHHNSFKHFWNFCLQHCIKTDSFFNNFNYGRKAFYTFHISLGNRKYRDGLSAVLNFTSESSLSWSLTWTPAGFRLESIRSIWDQHPKIVIGWMQPQLGAAKSSS